MSNNKESLLTLKQELTQRVQKIDADLHSRHTSSKFSEQVVESQNTDVLLNLKNEAQFELEQIQRALIRIQNGEYGICTSCREPIAAERLEAVPYTSLCAKCVV